MVIILGINQDTFGLEIVAWLILDNKIRVIGNMNKSLAIFFLCTLLYSIVESSAVTLNKNAYRGVVIAINPEIAEDPILITSIQVRS